MPEALDATETGTPPPLPAVNKGWTFWKRLTLTLVSVAVGLWLLVGVMWWAGVAWLNQSHWQGHLEHLITHDLLHRPQWHCTLGPLQGHWNPTGITLVVHNATLTDESRQPIVSLRRALVGLSLAPLLQRNAIQLNRIELDRPILTGSPEGVAVIEELLRTPLPANPLAWWVDPLVGLDSVALHITHGEVAHAQTLLPATFAQSLKDNGLSSGALTLWPQDIQATFSPQRLHLDNSQLWVTLANPNQSQALAKVELTIAGQMAFMGKDKNLPHNATMTLTPTALAPFSPWIQAVLKAKDNKKQPQALPPWVKALHTQGVLEGTFQLTGTATKPLWAGNFNVQKLTISHPRLAQPLLVVPLLALTSKENTVSLPATPLRWLNQPATLALHGNANQGTVTFNSPRIDLDAVIKDLNTLDPALTRDPAFPKITQGQGAVALTFLGPWQALQPQGKGSWAIQDFQLPMPQTSQSSSTPRAKATPRATLPLKLQSFNGAFALLPQQWVLSQVSARCFKGSVSGNGTLALTRPFTLPTTPAALKAFQNNVVTGDILASHVDVQALLAAVPEAADTLKAAGISPYQAGTVNANLHIHGKLNQVFQNTSQTTSPQGLQGIQGVSGVITLSGSEWQTPWGRLASDAFQLILGPNGLLFRPLASVKDALLHFRLDDIPIALSGEWLPNDPLPTGKIYVPSVSLQTLLQSPFLANALSTVGPLPAEIAQATGNISLYGERNTNGSLRGKLAWETLKTTLLSGHTTHLNPGTLSVSGKAQGDISVISSEIGLRVAPPVRAMATDPIENPYPAALITGQLSGTVPWKALQTPTAKNPPITLSTQWSVAPEGYSENPLRLDSQWQMAGPWYAPTKVETPNTRITLWRLGDVVLQGHMSDPLSNETNKRWVVASLSTPNPLTFQNGVQDALLPWYPADIQAQLLSQKSTAKALSKPTQGSINTQLAFVGNGQDNGMLMGQLAVNNLSLPLVDVTQLNGTVTYNGLDAQVALDKIALPGTDLSVKAHIVDDLLFPIRLDDMAIDGGQFSVPALQYWVANVLDKRINQALMQPLMAAWQPQAVPNTPIALATPTATPDLPHPSPPLPPLAPLPIVFENAKLSIKEVVYDNILIDDVTGTLSLFESGFFDLHQAHGTVASGTVDASLSMDPLKNNFTRVTLNAHQLSSNALLTALLNAPNQLFGNIDGQIRFTTEGATPEAQMDATNGTATFTIADGRVPAIARIEKLLTAVNVLRGGVLGLSANNLLRLASPFKTEYVADMSGTLTLLEGNARTDDLLSDGADLDLLTEGTMRLKDGESDLTVYGDMSQSVRGRLGRVGKFSLLNVVRWVPGVGYFPWERNRQKLGGLLAYVPGVGFVPFLGGPLGDRQRFEVRLKGLLDSPTVVESFQWAP